MKSLSAVKMWDIRIFLFLPALLMFAYIWGGTYYRLQDARQAVLDVGERDVRNYARTLEEHTLRTVQEVDQTTIFLAARYLEEGDRLDLAEYIKSGKLLTGVYHQIAILGTNGDLILSNLPMVKMNLSDREHFKVHQQQDTGKLFISKPVMGRLSKKWSIQMSRRINDGAGKFLGVVVVSVDPLYFIRFYDELNLGRSGVVTLAGEDGLVRARRAGSGTEIGQDISQGSAFKTAVQQVNGTVEAVSKIDSLVRLYGFRKIKNYPLYVFVGMGKDNLLQEYQSQKMQTLRLAGITSVLLLAFCIFVHIALGRLLSSQHKLMRADIAKNQLLEDLERQQQALGATNARLDAILQNAGDAIISLDSQGKIESLNHAAEKIFARPIQTGISIQELIPAISALHWFQTGLADLTLSSVQRADGKTLFLEIASSRVNLSGVEKCILIVRDVSERRQAERLQQEFVSTVSHELRTPLTSIRGALGLIEGGAVGSLPERAQQLIKLSVTNADRLIRLINDLLDVQKLESGVLSMSFAHYALPQLITEAMEANLPFAARNGNELQLCGSVPDLVLNVDGGRFQQVMANLISNACKYGGKNSPVRIACQVLDAEDGAERRLRIEICDRGPGISEAFKARIFQKFAQADSSNTKHQGGSGLGLSIAKAIVNQMSGEIGFHAVAGGGTCFYFDLPVVVGAARGDFSA